MFRRTHRESPNDDSSLRDNKHVMKRHLQVDEDADAKIIRFLRFYFDKLPRKGDALDSDVHFERFCS